MVTSSLSLAELRLMELKAEDGEIDFDEYNDAEALKEMSTVLAFQPESDSWVELPPMLAPHVSHYMLRAGADLVVYDWCVESPEQVILQLELFQSSTQTWSRLKPPSVPTLRPSQRYRDGGRRVAALGLPKPWLGGTVEPTRTAAPADFEGAAVAVIHCVGGKNQFERPGHARAHAHRDQLTPGVTPGGLDNLGGWSEDSDGPPPATPVVFDKCGKQLSCSHCFFGDMDPKTCAVAVHENLYCCSQCRAAWYCSSACQRAAFKSHKLVCSDLKVELKMMAAITKQTQAAASEAVKPEPEPAPPADPRPKCARADCFFLRHETQGHGYCCNACKGGSGHGGACGRELMPGVSFPLGALEDDLLVSVLASGALDARDLGRLACVSRRFSSDLIEQAARLLVLDSARSRASANQQFETELERLDIKAVDKARSGFHDHGYPLSREHVIEMWGYEGELDADEWPSEEDLAEERRENAEAKAAFESVKARLAATQQRKQAAKAAVESIADPRLRDERWLQVLNRTAKRLVFTTACADHMTLRCAGEVAMPRPPPEWHTYSTGAYTSAVCAAHPMAEGVHRADFQIGKRSGPITLGVMLSSHDEMAHNHGRGPCTGAFCGRPTDTKSAWGFSHTGHVHHIWGTAHRYVGDGEGFGEGDTIRLELELDGQWGGHVTARSGNRVRTAKMKSPGTRAVLTAYKNGERLGTVANFEKRPRTGFVWLCEMFTGNDWVRISRPEGKEFGFGVTQDTERSAGFAGMGAGEGVRWA